MKKSEFISKLMDLLPNAEYSRHGQDKYEQANEILNYFIESGFHLPQKQCIMVEDTLNGGTKHSPIEYGWNEE